MFKKLDNIEIIDEDDKNINYLIINTSINKKNIQENAIFMSSIGYMAQQISLIEDEIRQSMVTMTDDYNSVYEQTNRKNLGALISLYELVFLSKWINNEKFKKYLFAVKKILVKANKYRNNAVHTQWAYIKLNDTSPEKPCFEKTIKGKGKYIIITPELMFQRAVFCHKAFNYIAGLRAVTESIDDKSYNSDYIEEAKKDLDNLVKGILKV